MNDMAVQQTITLERQKLTIQLEWAGAAMDDEIEASQTSVAAAMADIVGKAVAKLQQDILSAQVLLKADIKVMGLELKSDISRLDERVNRVDQRVIHVEGRVAEVEERFAAEVNRVERKVSAKIEQAEQRLTDDVARVEVKLDQSVTDCDT